MEKTQIAGTIGWSSVQRSFPWLHVTEEEVKRAQFSIGDLKAPGPDGLHANFYKNSEG